MKSTIMPTSCAAYGCKNRYCKDSPVQYFTFPFKRPDILKKWIHAVRRVNWRPTQHSRLCSCHFTDSSYQKRPGADIKLLKEDAVPSIFNFPTLLRKKKKKKNQKTDKKKLVRMPTAAVSAAKSPPKKRKRNIKEIYLEKDWDIEEELGLDFINEVTKEHSKQLNPFTEKSDGKYVMEEEHETEEMLEKAPQATSLCRLCASPSEDVIYLYKNQIPNNTLLEKIHTYLPIMITAEDLLPTTVCGECVNKLEICHSLVQGCLDADIVLKTKLNLQMQNSDKSADNFLDESDLCSDYNYANLADVKFEVESNDNDPEEQSSNRVAGERIDIQNNDAFQNSNTRTLDTKMMGDMQIVNKEPALMNNPRKRRRKQIIKFSVERMDAADDVTTEVDLQKILELAMNAAMEPSSSESHMLKERHKPPEMPSVTSRKEISRLKDKEKDIIQDHEEITEDHSYTRYEQS